MEVFFNNKNKSFLHNPFTVSLNPSGMLVQITDPKLFKSFQIDAKDLTIMKTNKNQNKWLIDAGLFAGFMILFWLDLTGVALHQWLGVAIGVLVVYHLVTHWKWVKTVTERFFKRTSQQARLFYLVDAGLGSGFALILATGLVISTWFSLSLGNYAAWKNVHNLSSIATLLLLVVKIGAHWRMIVQNARKTIFVSQEAAPKTQPAQPVQTLSTGRRDFMKLMGVVGAASLLAAGRALDEIEAASSREVSSAQLSSVQDSTSSTVWDSNSTTTACSVRCPRGCGYPGHCQRYTDSNGNQRCDFGECM